jgi:hypothetical protein
MRLAAPSLALVCVLACAGGARAQAADTGVVHVRGPTVVACARPVSQAVLDAGGDMATVMDDFGWHWSEAVDALRAHGIAAEARTGGWVWLRTGDRLRSVRCPRPVGYVMVAPGRLPKVLAGVRTDSDLLDAAAAYFRRRDLARKEHGDGGQR